MAVGAVLAEGVSAADQVAGGFMLGNGGLHAHQRYPPKDKTKQFYYFHRAPDSTPFAAVGKPPENPKFNGSKGLAAVIWQFR
jgi:hypothetical protein